MTRPRPALVPTIGSQNQLLEPDPGPELWGNGRRDALDGYRLPPGAGPDYVRGWWEGRAERRDLTEAW